MTSNNQRVGFDCKFKIDVNNWRKKVDFHLFDGKVDSLIIHIEINKRKVFRFMRLGSYNEIFSSKTVINTYYTIEKTN